MKTWYIIDHDLEEGRPGLFSIVARKISIIKINGKDGYKVMTNDGIEICIDKESLFGTFLEAQQKLYKLFYDGLIWINKTTVASAKQYSSQFNIVNKLKIEE